MNFKLISLWKEVGQLKNQVLTSLLLTGIIWTSGCATKKYVAKTTDPIRNRVDQVGKQADQQGQQITQQGDELKKQGTELGKQGTELGRQGSELEKQQTELNANKERAIAADNRATDALKKGEENTRQLGELRQVVSNLDDYKVAGSVVVPFAFNKDVLTANAKQELDRLVTDKATLKRYFIAVEGFTDKSGSASYNDALSKRRAEHVVQYLVAKHDIPVYRIHEIGLGKEKLADTGRGKQANAKNRRVEVTFYSADAAMSVANGSR
jgi:outer membrane protein OmpA-like peptidoglycan-associated protein